MHTFIYYGRTSAPLSSHEKERNHDGSTRPERGGYGKMGWFESSVGLVMMRA